MKYTPKANDKYIHTLGNQQRVLSVRWHEATYDWLGWCGEVGELMHEAGWALEGDKNNNYYFIWWDNASDKIRPYEREK